MNQHVALCESVLHAGLARGRVDVDALAQLVGGLHAGAVLWAHEQLPREMGPKDTVWVVADQQRDWQRIGPTEWARGGGYADLRRTALALGVLAAASRKLRERDEDEPIPAGLADDAGLGELDGKRFSSLVLHAFLPILRTRPLEWERPVLLWRELLGALSELDADHRPLIVWMGPLWVADLVSPYTREVQPLLAKWAREQADLPRLAEAITQGDADATYMCANLFDDPEVLREREAADATVGIHTIADPDGVRLAKIIDTARLDLQAVDARLALDALEEPAPLVIVLNGADPDTGYALTRLLVDVNADFRAVQVCIAGIGDTPVATSRMAAAAHGGVILAAPAAGLDNVRPLGLPDLAYLRIFDVPDAYDALFELHRAAQDSLGEALWRGDVAGMEQRFWLEPSDDAALLDAKRAHIADALRLWRSFLGLQAPQTPAPRSPGSAKKPKPGALRFRA